MFEFFRENCFIPNIIQDAGRRQGKIDGEHTSVCDPTGFTPPTNLQLE